MREFDDLDWNHLWQTARRRQAWKRKSRADWDRKASGFAGRNKDSFFISRLLELLQPHPEWSVLDVGSGPGILTLPLARQVRQVTAIDFSEAMLEELRKAAVLLQADNIATRLLSWTDDWQEAGVEPHDIAISSRSLSVFDLKSALQKLDGWAVKKAVVVDRAGCGPFDPDLFEAVGRVFEPGPDYIFTLNCLYQMGITAKLDFIEYNQVKKFTDRQEAIDSCRWMLDPLSKEEEEKLSAYFEARLSRDSDGNLLLHRSKPVKWAFISWDKAEQVMPG